MKYMKAAEFKAKCLRVMDEVAMTGEEVVVTKRGMAIVRVLPSQAAGTEKIGWGAGSDITIGYTGDIISPLEDEWDMDERNLIESPVRPPVDDPSV